MPVDVRDIVVDVPLAVLEDDPHPTYAEMRHTSPVAYIPEAGKVVVTTWRLCEKAGAEEAAFGPTFEVFDRVYGTPNVLSLTGAEHAATRNALNPPFRPRAVRGYEDELLRATAARYIDRIRPHGKANAGPDLLEPISQRAIGNLLGLSDVDDPTIARWFQAYGRYLVDFGRDPEAAADGRAAKEQVRAYLQTRTAELLEEPDGSSLAHLLTGGLPAGEHRSVDEVIGSLGVMIVGGIQEPAHAAANSLLGLLSDAAFAARFSADPKALSALAIEEGLRWIAPFGTTSKRIAVDVVLDDVLLPAGTEIAMAIDSANRDPDRFDHPDVFDIDRADAGHMSFGFGLHFCVGHFVARTFGRVILEEMFARLPGLRLDPDIEPVVHGWNVRGAKVLPIVWDA